VNQLSKRLVPGEAQTIDSVVSYGGDKVLIGSNASIDWIIWWC
jgi:hypothetical protein